MIRGMLSDFARIDGLSAEGVRDQQDILSQFSIPSWSPRRRLTILRSVTASRNGQKKGGYTIEGCPLFVLGAVTWLSCDGMI